MKKNTIFIGISGASASGKSLLAKTIYDELGSDQVVVIHEDSYYKDQSDIPFEKRVLTNYDHPNAFDHPLLRDHMDALEEGKTVNIPVYDFATHNRSPDTETVGKHTIVVLEGIMLFASREILSKLDIKIFMDAPLDICLLRRLRRDIILRNRTMESVLEQYETTVRPMYMQFIEPAKRHADIIIPRGGENRIAIEVIKAKMKELLASANGNI